jgi:hypothetical protein
MKIITRAKPLTTCSNDTTHSATIVWSSVSEQIININYINTCEDNFKNFQSNYFCNPHLYDTQ